MVLVIRWSWCCPPRLLLRLCNTFLALLFTPPAGYLMTNLTHMAGKELCDALRSGVSGQLFALTQMP